MWKPSHVGWVVKVSLWRGSRQGGQRWAIVAEPTAAAGRIAVQRVLLAAECPFRWKRVTLRFRRTADSAGAAHRSHFF